MVNKIVRKIKSFTKSNNISLGLSFVAIIISLSSMLYTKFAYDDKKVNAKIMITINRLNSLLEYKNRINLIFEKNSANIINMAKREKGIAFLNDNNNLIEYMFLTKVIYDLVNDSYEQFFSRNNIYNVYTVVGGSINLYDIMYLSEILWNNNNLDDISNSALDKMIENLSLIDISLKRDNLNTLLEKVDEEIRMESEKVEISYNKALRKNNLEKELIEEYYRLDDSHNGLTIVQKDWFNQYSEKKIRKIDHYLNIYLSSVLFNSFLDELMIKALDEK